MTDQEARKIWESVSLKFENRLTVTPWEAFCVKFNDERRHVKNLASWEGRELLLAQLPNDIRCKLITEEEKRSRFRMKVGGLDPLSRENVFEFFKRVVGVNLSGVTMLAQGLEIQVRDETDMTRVMSFDRKALTTGRILETSSVRFQMSEREIMDWVTNYLRVEEMSRAYAKPGWRENRDARPAGPWKTDQKAREVKIECKKESIAPTED